MDTSIEPDAFRQIYPHEYLQRFLAQGVRSDGRPLGRARSLSVTTEAVSSAEGSCLAKAGRTAVLAGVKALVGPPTVEAPTRGQLHVTLELPALCNPDLRPGKPGDAALDLSARLAHLLAAGNVVDLDALCVTPHASCWHLHVDAVVLCDDGAVLDVALVAALGALGTTALPALYLSHTGRLQAVEGAAAGPPVDGQALAFTARQLALCSIPASLTCGLYGAHVLVDPSREEEALMQALVSCCWCRPCGGAGVQAPVLAVHKAGGEACASVKTLLRCVAASQGRHGDVERALTAAGARIHGHDAAAATC